MKEALKLAREALTSDGWKKTGDAIRAIDEALAQPEQEPVAVSERDKDRRVEEDKRVFARIKDWARRKQKPEQEPLIPFRHGCKWCGKTEGCDHHKRALAQPPEHQNFCTRCGKRTNEVHTCTPPEGGHQ